MRRQHVVGRTQAGHRGGRRPARGTRGPGRRGPWAVGVAVALLAAAAAAHAGGGKPAPKPPPPGAAQPVGKLPAGCVRLVDGRHATLSPDGTLLAFGRVGFDAARADARGKPATVSELWVRDLAKKKEWRLPQEAAPDGWTDGGALLLRSGVAVEPQKGTPAAGVATLPPRTDVMRPAWTRDGTRLAFVPRVRDDEGTAVRVVGPDGQAVPLAGTEGLRTDQAVILTWSPDGAHLYVHARFSVDAGGSVRRVLLVDPTSGAAKVLAEMPAWIDVPGHYGAESEFFFPAELEERMDTGRTIAWKRPTGPRYGGDVFDAKGTRCTWVAGATRKEADAFVADVATGTVHRVTVDGETKWSPALDPAGRRLAFLMADASWRGNDGLTRRRLRVLDLATGAATDLPLAAADGVPGTLEWTPDGAALLYELRGGSIGGVFRQTVAPAPAADGAAVVEPVLDRKARLVAWLGSPDGERVSAAAAQISEAWDPAYGPAVRAALPVWVPRVDTAGPALLALVRRHRVTEAAPEVAGALGAKQATLQLVAIRTLGELGVPTGLDELDRLRTGRSFELRVAAAAAMVQLHDARGWETLRAATKEPAPAARVDVIAALARLRDPVAVDLLLPYLDDPSRLHDRGADSLTVANTAALALRVLSGVDHGTDAAAWRSWWAEDAKRVLPADPGPPPAEARWRLGL